MIVQTRLNKLNLAIFLFLIFIGTSCKEKYINQINLLENKVDSLQNIIYCLEEENYFLFETMDSLPLGSPLKMDTLRISSQFGTRRNPLTFTWQRHQGTDFLADWRDSVLTTGHGIVELARYRAGYGRCVIINHVGGYKTLYAHLNKIFVKKGQKVMRGDAIGTAGNTGSANGYHLHYEVQREEINTNPVDYIDKTERDTIISLNYYPIKVKATMYHPLAYQCDDNPLVTADGSIIDPHNVSNWNWIAVSQDMLRKNGGLFNYGDKVYISGTHKDGVYVIHDCMNRRKTNQIDFLESIGTHQYRYSEIELYALH